MGEKAQETADLEPTATSSHPGADDWERHWERYAGSAAENPAQRYRRRLITRALELPAGGGRLLDIGSGTGDLLAELRRELPQVEMLGVELSAAGVAISSRKVPSATFVVHDLMSAAPLPVDRARWATHAVCSEVLEHVDDPAALLRNARRLLAPGCRVVVTVPGGPMSAFDRHIGHRRHFSPPALRAVLERAGLEVESARGAGFPFFNLYRLTMVALGPRLIRVAEGEGELEGGGRLGRLAMRAFDLLFRLNLDGPRLGFQTIAVAREPPPAAGAATAQSE